MDALAAFVELVGGLLLGAGQHLGYFLESNATKGNRKLAARIGYSLLILATMAGFFALALYLAHVAKVTA
jgi:hypothetical protein